MSSMSDEEYERLRAGDIKEMMNFVNAVLRVPRKNDIVDMEPYRTFDETQRMWREGLSPDDANLPLDQLAPYLRVLPTKGAIYIPNYRRAKLHFGIPLTAEEIILCAVHLNFRIKPIHGKDKQKRRESCMANVQKAGHDIAKYLSRLCNHHIVSRYAAGLDGLFVFAIYSNYNQGDFSLEERDEKVILDVIGKILNTERPAKWYHEGYSD